MARDYSGRSGVSEGQVRVRRAPPEIPRTKGGGGTGTRPPWTVGDLAWWDAGWAGKGLSTALPCSADGRVSFELLPRQRSVCEGLQGT